VIPPGADGWLAAQQPVGDHDRHRPLPALGQPFREPGQVAGGSIAATAAIKRATLVTADDRILGWEGSLFRLDARS
jgi:hypothetical protein